MTGPFFWWMRDTVLGLDPGSIVPLFETMHGVLRVFRLSSPFIYFQYPC